MPCAVMLYAQSLPGSTTLYQFIMPGIASPAMVHPVCRCIRMCCLDFSAHALHCVLSCTMQTFTAGTRPEHRLYTSFTPVQVVCRVKPDSYGPACSLAYTGLNLALPAKVAW